MARVVYFARGLVSGLTKIGCSDRVRGRIHSLALQFREPVELLATTPGTWPEEYALHRQYAALRHHGDARRGREWYRDDGSIAALVASLTPPTTPLLVTPGPPKRHQPKRPAAVIAAEKAARRAVDDARFLARHGHAQGTWRKLGCAECVRDAERFKRWHASHGARLQRAPTPNEAA